jgi:uncharacterized protein
MIPFPEYPSLTLLPEGAALLRESATLIVADVHLGKSASFRAQGLPVPEGDSARDFQRLEDLCRKHQAAQLVVAGDLFHAAAGLTQALENALADFIQNLGIPMSLVLGNHDAKIRRLPLACVPHLDLEDRFRIIHDPAEADGRSFHIAGHLHPVVKIPDGARTSLHLPCFLFRERTLVLPAFGSFTGGAIVTTGPEDRIFTALRNEVVELPAALLARPGRARR